MSDTNESNREYYRFISAMTFLWTFVIFITKGLPIILKNTEDFDTIYKQWMLLLLCIISSIIYCLNRERNEREGILPR